MKVDRYLKYVEEIEQKIQEMRPDAIVFGMGPTAWLLPWIDQRLLQGVELWTSHDGCRIMPADHVVIMDGPTKALNPDTSRYEHIVNSRPRRFWIIAMAWRWEKEGHAPRPLWEKHLPTAVHGIVNVLRYRVWNPNTHPKAVKPKLDSTDKDGNITPDTMAISPAGAATTAWATGKRRIGVIGCDMMKNHHHTFNRSQALDSFFCCIANQAHERGGAIFNLSPITSMTRFKEWQPPTSGSQATGGNEKPAQSESSSSASESTRAAT